MGQEPKPSPKKARGAKTASVVPPGNEEGASSVDLITFKPSLAIVGDVPASKTDASALVRRRMARWIAALGALALVCVVLFLGPGVYRSFKAWRATALALKGEELVEKNQIQAAIPDIRSAFLLSPDAPEVVRAMARILTALDAPDAMTYWDWVLKDKGATNDDRRAAAECAMHNGLYDEASLILSDLVTRDGGDARNQLLAAQWSARRSTPAQAMFYATRAVNDDPTYKPAVLFLAVRELTNSYLHQEGVNSLLKLAEANDDSGLTALRELAHDPSLKPAEIDRLIARLRTHPLAAEPEHIAALSLEIKRHPDQRKTLVDQAVAAHQNAAPADLAVFAEWLNGNGEAARVLKLIPRERALSNKSLFAAYIDALGELKRWADLKTILTGASVPLEAPFIELYLSRCASEMGDDQGSDLHWQNAVSAAAYNPAQSVYLAIYAENLGQNRRAAAVYRALTLEPVTARIAYLGLLRVSNDQNTRTLRDLLDEMVTRWPKDPKMASQDIYFNLLLKEHVKEMHRRAVKLMARDSYLVSNRTNVALACLRLNDPAGALKAYDHASIDWNTATVPDRVVYAAMLNANGHAKAAHQLLLPINRHKLRPEARDLIKSIP